MLMNDSGNESEDRLDSLFSSGLEKTEQIIEVRLNNNSDSDAESDIYTKMNELDVMFSDLKDKNSSIPSKDQPSTNLADLLVESEAPVVVGIASNRKILTSDNSTESYSSSIANSSAVSTQEDDTKLNPKVTQINTCKILQRKLELKVERAKRNYRQMYEEQDYNQETAPKSASLIPISRLSIPGGPQRELPLVDVNPTGGNSDEDDLDQVSFFPKAPRKNLNDTHTRQELSDTFSIQEMTIESDQEDQLDFQQCRKLSNSKGYKKILNRGVGGRRASNVNADYLDNDMEDFDEDEYDDSQNLELLPPKSRFDFKELAQRMMCCFRRNDFLS
ncbi:uncharacterized protein LOC129759889 [Uranotaenia lowii]|uniref:uncharacterized protein LOC129759889 n=1 Tax=Uranotaenia lowii TaxID=190385 RepID=UPI00247862B6|nr:uncharacterized protein LOC129759889 [Uranotaenia lowii]